MDCDKALPWGTRLDHLAPEIRSCVPFDLVLAADCSGMARKFEHQFFSAFLFLNPISPHRIYRIFQPLNFVSELRCIASVAAQLPASCPHCAAFAGYDFVNPETPSPSIDALLATAKSLGRRALICVSRRPHEVEAFTCSVERAGLSQMATVVYNEEMNAEKEGVPECLVYSFNFAESFQSRAGEC